MSAQVGGARDPRAPQLPRPGAAARAVGPVALGAAVAAQLAVDRRAMPTPPPGDLALAQTHLHQVAQAVTVSLSRYCGLAAISEIVIFLVAIVDAAI